MAEAFLRQILPLMFEPELRNRTPFFPFTN
jgi:hypothetical protein